VGSIPASRTTSSSFPSHRSSADLIVGWSWIPWI